MYMNIVRTCTERVLAVGRILARRCFLHHSPARPSYLSPAIVFANSCNRTDNFYAPGDNFYLNDISAHEKFVTAGAVRFIGKFRVRFSNVFPPNFPGLMATTRADKDDIHYTRVETMRAVYQ